MVYGLWSMVRKGAQPLDLLVGLRQRQVKDRALVETLAAPGASCRVEWDTRVGTVH
jgi:hypothetical protein